MFGFGGVIFTGKPATSGGGNATAANGVSINPIVPGEVNLGNDVGFPGNPAQWTTIREIQTNSAWLQLVNKPSNEITQLGSGWIDCNISPITRKAFSFGTDQRDGLFGAFFNPSNWGVITVPNFDWVFEKVDNGDGTFNTPLKWGWNVNRIDNNTLPGQFLSMEPRFISGGVPFLEFHYTIDEPDGTECRVFSSTFRDNGSAATSQNTWDFRATQWNLSTVDNTFSYASATEQGFVVSGRTVGQGAQLRLADASPGGSVADLQSVNNELTVLGVGLLAASQTAGVNFRMRMNGQATRMDFLRTNGTAYLMLLNGPGAGGGFADDFYIFDVQHNFMPFRSRAAEVMINGDGQTPNGAMLQVFGDITTNDPGSGVGKWLLGKFTAGAVALDAANYVEVKIDGVIRKLLIAV
jgi:hypothetical protein